MNQAEGGAVVELGLRGERPVLAEPSGGRWADPRQLPLGEDLTDALYEWAKVAGAVRRTGGETPRAEAAAVVSRRGRQLAGRVAAALGVRVSYRDPVTGRTVVVAPPERPPRPSVGRRLLGEEPSRSTPTPWGTGLVVAAFIGAVVAIAMLALARTLAEETTGWLAFGATVVVTAGLAPSLWLARKLPIVRWVVLGAAGGLVFAWIGVLAILW
ncbi:uncharacterized protein DUF2537 [Prauserella shujinwangii]|uniref:Uncharacterized protein DUF2537 n=1 Tax=Prauserella shujinwangii TaxID=1453103 RepID=A0A2T0M0U5_9PSEU|nr:DUF2537 domain-containing protein [Prauserella shujinwangii]PRX50223.1 uncharacterized protein DUF2537 [Prauserella shujinwangii]